MGPGSFPRFRISTKPRPSSWAREGPNRKPLESRPVRGKECQAAALRHSSSVPIGQGWRGQAACDKGHLVFWLCLEGNDTPPRA